LQYVSFEQGDADRIREELLLAMKAGGLLSSPFTIYFSFILLTDARCISSFGWILLLKGAMRIDEVAVPSPEDQVKSGKV
jgi:hypothetical protein